MERNSTADGAFVRKALIVIALGGVALLLWQLRTVVLLLFGAVVVATVVRAIADPLSKHLRLPEGVAVLIAVLLIVGDFPHAHSWYDGAIRVALGMAGAVIVVGVFWLTPDRAPWSRSRPGSSSP